MDEEAETDAPTLETPKSSTEKDVYRFQSLQEIALSQNSTAVLQCCSLLFQKCLKDVLR